MSPEPNKPLPRIGELLVSRGLLSHDDLAKALEIQQTHKSEKIGHVLCRMGLITQTDIERCLIEDGIAPHIIRELEAITEGSYSTLANTRLSFLKLLRTRLVTDNLLDGSVESSEVTTINGEAVVYCGDQTSLPFEFCVDPATCAVTIDPLFRGGLRIYLRRLIAAAASGEES